MTLAVAVAEPPASLRRPARAAARPATVAVLAAAAFLLLLSPGTSASPGGEALSLFGKSKRSKPKVLATFKNYEVKYLPRGPGKGPGAVIPRLKLQKIPPKPLSLKSIGATTEGNVDKELKTFPFTTQNTATVQLGFPRFGGSLKLSGEDPPVSLDVEDAHRSLEAAYSQTLPGIGDIGMRVNTKGDWAATYAREVEDLGEVTGGFNSQLDWHADLEKDYPTWKGVSPVVTYGANQDGMRVKAKLDHSAENGIRSSYTVQNLAGKYAPADFLHDGLVAASSKGGRHTIEARGRYDRRLPKLPVRGSLAYTVKSRPLTLEASVDYDRYRLKAKSGFAQVSAAVGTREELTSTSAGVKGRPAELELKLGKVTALTTLREGSPKLRLDLAL